MSFEVAIRLYRHREIRLDKLMLTLIEATFQRERKRERKSKPGAASEKKTRHFNMNVTCNLLRAGQGDRLHSRGCIVA